MPVCATDLVCLAARSTPLLLPPPATPPPFVRSVMGPARALPALQLLDFHAAMCFSRLFVCFLAFAAILASCWPW